MNFQALGFAPEELHPCEVVDRRLLVSASLCGEPVRFLVDTGASAAIELSLKFLEQRGSFVDAIQPMRARAPGHPAFRIGTTIAVGALEVLGERHDLERAAASELYRFDSLARKRGGGPPIAGSLGADFFADGVLALDLAGARLGFSRRPDRPPTLPVAAHTLALLRGPQGGPPVCDSLRDGWSDAPLALYIDTGVQATALAHDAFQRRLSGRGLASRFRRWAVRRQFRKRGTVPVALSFPDGHTWWLRPSLVASLAGMAGGFGDEVLDGWIGMDLFERWGALFYFAGGYLHLYHPHGIAPTAGEART